MQTHHLYLVAPGATYVSLNFDNPELRQIMPWTGTRTGPEAVLDTYTRVNRFWHGEAFEMLATALTAQSQALSEWKKLAEGLMGYAEHPAACVYSWRDPSPRCTCGLSALMEEKLKC